MTDDRNKHLLAARAWAGKAGRQAQWMREYVRGEFSVTQCLEVSHDVQKDTGKRGVYEVSREGRVCGEGEGHLRGS